MATIQGTGGNDTITPGLVSPGVVGGPATTGADSILGLAGNDVLDGGDGHDTLDGGTGDDSLTGGNGNDLLLGGDGSDTLVAGGTSANDTLNGGSGSDELRGRDVIDSSARSVFLIGGSGNDTIRGYGINNNFADYASLGTGINANLAAGTVVIGIETDTLDQVRGIRGGTGADTIIGTAFNDWIFGGNGADSIDAGGGNDIISYGDVAAGVTVDLLAGYATDAGGATDTLLGFETVFGSNFADRITGNAADNRIDGLAGNDTLDGGAGFDTVRYTATFNSTAFPQSQGAIVNLSFGTATDPWGNLDTLSNFEAASGSNLNDDLTGIALTTGEESLLRGLAGNDTLRAPIAGTRIAADYREDPGAVRVNLSDGGAVLGGMSVAALSARDGFGGTDSLVNIQVVICSTAGDTVLGADTGDTLYGLAGDDSLAGGAGDDLIYGGTSKDSLSGGSGYDFVIFGPRNSDDFANTQGVVANLATGQVANDGYGFAETFAANDVEALVGTRFGDDLTGKRIAETGEFGQTQTSFLRGDDGADTIRAAATDSFFVAAAYNRDPGAVTVNLITQKAVDGWGNTDTLVNIGAVRGSAFGDLLLGNADNNFFRGEGGNDTIDGGGGIDLVSYFGSTGAVVLDLTAGHATYGLGGTDSLSNIEQATGSATAGDTLAGSAVDNLLVGYGGADSLAGLDGRDTLRGDDGADTLDGGSGADSLTGGAGDDRFLVDDIGDVTVETAGGGLDLVQASLSWILQAETENLLLTGKTAINGTGNTAANTLTGNTGANVLSGLGANDMLVGGSGDDTLIGGSGADQLDGGRGLDVFRYSNATEGGDAILAFSPDDAFEISAAGFGGGLFAGIDIKATGRFVSNKTGKATAVAGTGQFVFESDTDILRWDPDGKGIGAAMILATIDGGNPTAADFIVVA